MHATCIDIDITAAQMAYIQLSLLDLPPAGPARRHYPRRRAD